MRRGQDVKKHHSRSMCRFRSADQASFWVEGGGIPPLQHLPVGVQVVLQVADDLGEGLRRS